MGSNKRKAKKRQAARNRREQTARHYFKMCAYIAGIATSTSTAGWAVANVAVPAVEVILGV